ncbi:hypothetical protein Vretifemale_12096 [Volvox reticuliferus]|uniref:Uncharacterized protein n=1 Tax=Volvox reticuliferus TaxID=1737510 RepID=A0A8J4CN75_9CHLO|nr:hypothetical protein Vretifemale_12096 [Volvox reticuliferus]
MDLLSALYFPSLSLILQLKPRFLVFPEPPIVPYLRVQRVPAEVEVHVRMCALTRCARGGGPQQEFKCSPPRGDELPAAVGDGQHRQRKQPLRRLHGQAERDHAAHGEAHHVCAAPSQMVLGTPKVKDVLRHTQKETNASTITMMDSRTMTASASRAMRVVE